MRLFSILFTAKSFNMMKGRVKATEKEIRIKVPWGQIAAITWGESSSPPVVLCHGKMDVCSGFRPLVSLLPESLFYVSIELPGNGKSDKFPSGSRFTTADYVPVILSVQKHFQWEHFMYVGHSLGVVIGKYFNLAYPGVISRFVELEPVPAYDAWTAENFNTWYHLFYGDYYSENKYKKYNAGSETAPKYTYEKAMSLMLNTRGLTEEAAKHVLERALEPAGDGLYRFTHDQRQKEITRLFFTPEVMQRIYTSVATPTFTVLAKMMVELGLYTYTPFVIDETAWPNRNFKVKIVEGGHDVHINNPELMADDVAKFLLDSKAKL